MSLQLRYYQRQAIDAVGEARARGKRRLLVVLPTGTGKTVIFANLVAQLVGAGGSALILAHRDELIGQAVKKLREVAPELGMSIGIVKGKHDQTRAPAVVASVQTLARPQRLIRLPRNFDIVIVDEAHHAAADSYLRILEHVGETPVIGFTATPKRHDKRQLEDVFEEVAYARSIEEMVREGFLVAPIGKAIRAADLDLGEVKQSRGDFTAQDLGRAMVESDATADVRQAILEHAAERKSIIFVPTVAIAKEMALALSREGIEARDINGSTPEHVRSNVLRRFARREIQAIVNVGVLTEGFDDPAVDCIVIARPTKSQGLYTQMIGRGLRLYPDKQDCLVLDLVGASEELSIQCLPALFGVEEIREGENAIEAIDREHTERERAKAAALQRGREKAERRALQRKRRRHEYSDIGFFNRDRLHWLRHGERWILDATPPASQEQRAKRKRPETELLVLDPKADGSWWVLLVNANRARPIQRNLDLGYAQGVAEGVVRQRRAIGLNDKEARWRRERPSNGQLALLRRKGVRKVPKTKGEASDALTMAIAIERLERLDRALTQAVAA